MMRFIGRYALFQQLAHGGMGAVHIGRLRGASGFSRTVAIKKLHADMARDPAFVAMFREEARLAARIRHPNVASVIDHAAHEAQSEQGEPLHIVRSDVYSASVVLWEALTGRRFFSNNLDAAKLLSEILGRVHVPPSTFRADLPAEIDAIVMKGLERSRDDRWSTAKEMADAIEHVVHVAVHVASASKVGAWVADCCNETLTTRARMISVVEATELPQPTSSRPCPGVTRRGSRSPPPWRSPSSASSRSPAR